MHPLSHHEIISLVAPFTRHGCHVDLAASDRTARTLYFRPVDHPAGMAGLPAFAETLKLDNPEQGRFRLTRTLAAAHGAAANLVAEGPDAGLLLEQVRAIPATQQLVALEGAAVARSHTLELDAGRPRLMLAHAIATIGTLTLTLKMPAVRGMPADLDLKADADTGDFPEDLLAVLGWKWTRLIRAGKGWRASVRLRGTGEARSRDAEARFDAAALHLARTLSRLPAAFHRQHRLARWGVFARRGIPLAAIIALIAGGIAIPSLDLAQESVLRMLIFNSPPLLMILVFGMREVPRIEIPPLPRASAAPAWNIAGPAAHVPATVET